MVSTICKIRIFSPSADNKQGKPGLWGDMSKEIQAAWKWGLWEKGRIWPCLWIGRTGSGRFRTRTSLTRADAFTGLRTCVSAVCPHQSQRLPCHPRCLTWRGARAAARPARILTSGNLRNSRKALFTPVCFCSENIRCYFFVCIVSSSVEVSTKDCWCSPTPCFCRWNHISIFSLVF